MQLKLCPHQTPQVAAATSTTQPHIEVEDQLNYSTKGSHCLYKWYESSVDNSCLRAVSVNYFTRSLVAVKQNQRQPLTSRSRAGTIVF